MMGGGGAKLRAVVFRLGLSLERIVVFGRSMGGAVAAGVARPGLGGLVLENTFPRLYDVAALHFPLLRYLPEAILKDTWHTVERLARFDGPILLISGTVSSARHTTRRIP